MDIRALEVEDLESLARLLTQLSESTHCAEEFSGPRLVEMFRAMTAQPESYLNLVAVDDGQVVGFISILFYASFIHRVGTAQINELIVDSLKRHSGIGTRLLQRAKEEARRRGVDEIEVSTERDNLSALRFYRSNGFDEEYVLLGRELGGPSPMA